MVRTMLREQWRSVIVESGALSVITAIAWVAALAGAGMMLQWSANSWDSREQVGCDVVSISNSDSS